MVWKYSCGHESKGIIVMNSNPTVFSSYLIWKDTVGLDGSMSQCWNCFCQELNKKKAVLKV